MKRRTLFTILFIAVLAVICVVSISAALWLRMDTTLEFTVRDSVSGKWVWGAVITLRAAPSLAFTNRMPGPRLYRFTHLGPERRLWRSLRTATSR